MDRCYSQPVHICHEEAAAIRHKDSHGNTGQCADEPIGGWDAILAAVRPPPPILCADSMDLAAMNLLHKDERLQAEPHLSKRILPHPGGFIG
jgi:hypothetical protein